jgi:hypothetical protein
VKALRDGLACEIDGEVGDLRNVVEDKDCDLTFKLLMMKKERQPIVILPVMY